ncbi:thyroid peroxidase-like [Ylistrum balloti]|uniref:thyroid peroxidase-like n=1 Tax=Ylistrum balloti TaxID=509963 RepID=UPI0029058C12|nr:thyroid peroxidase-like [Ylistrum balloti]
MAAIFEEAVVHGTQQLEELVQKRWDYAEVDKPQIGGSCKEAHYQIHSQTPEGETLEFIANTQLNTLEFVMQRSGLSLSTIRHDQELNLLWNQTFPSCLCNVTCESSEYRTPDGSCNNLQYPCWGMSETPQARLVPAEYGDVMGLGSAPRNATSGPDPVELPSARLVSLTLFRDFSKEDKDDKLSFEVMSWGQFIDHDIVFTPVSKGADGNSISCCVAPDNSTTRQPITDRVECAPIVVDMATDPHFTDTTCLDFVRSAPAVSTDSSCIPLKREQMNLATSFIDGSMVYGTTLERQNSLRDMTQNKGLMLVSPGNLPPPLGTNTTCRLTQETNEFCMKTGDGRTQVVPNLANDHVLLLGNHNTIVLQLAEITRWSEEKLFQEARKINIAIMQQITYGEYLPLILGPDLMNEYKLMVREPSHNIYNAAMNPTVFNNFAVAAFRFGHSQITDFQNFLSNYYNDTTVNRIEDTYLRPIFTVREQGKDLDKHTRWKVTTHSAEAGRLFPKGVLDLLFLDSLGHSLDLPAVNIQRGRDHGIPPYVNFLNVCGLAIPTTFDELMNHTVANRALLASVYNAVSDIDLFAGGMTEEFVTGGKVGPTFGCLLGKQFQALKHGDRFWFERSTVFNTAQLIELRKMTLAKVMCLNFDMCNIQPDAFKLPNFIYNRPTSCSNLPDMNYNVFRGQNPKPSSLDSGKTRTGDRTQAFLTRLWKDSDRGQNPSLPH